MPAKKKPATESASNLSTTQSSAALVASQTDPSVQPAGNFPIVGLGASAGGLAAFEAFFAALPSDMEAPVAFILVQHLAPDHKSILVDLLKHYTTMPVFEVEDGMLVRPNCVYITPPNHDMAFINGVLQLLEPDMPRGQRLPIDFFFRSLALDQHERAICIVLSGTGSDGTLGVRMVKGEGGMVMAQAPDSTEYNGMPRSAIATGLVDYVLPVAEMPAHLITYLAYAFGKRPSVVSPLLANDNALKKIFILLRAQTQHDFSQYKQNTITRRVARRMAVQQITSIDEYVRYLQQSPVELNALFHEFLIGVTSFFRDPDAFAALEAQAIARLFANKPAAAAIRVWVPACSTGEEAYSIAILLYERQEALKQNFKIQIFATDLDSRAIHLARGGVYPASIAADVTPERLDRFFTYEPANHVYRIKKYIRDLLIISEQDIIQSPPFSRLDLISCRNLLIYLGGTLQQKLMALFHYALNPGGLLFLGNSESVGEFVTLFAPLDPKWKLYQRQEDIPSAHRPALGQFLPAKKTGETMLELSGKGPHEKRPSNGKLRLRELTERLLLDEYAPVSVLVNAQGDILYIHGRTGRYLEPAPGEAGLNIMAMAREGLQSILSTALHKATIGRVPLHYPNVRVKTNGHFCLINLTVRPVANSHTHRADAELYLVTLAEILTTETVVADQVEATSVPGEWPGEELPTEDKAQLALLKQELRYKEEHLQSTREEMATANEELQSTNEELQSTNEELQSANEELETAKEELQSLNEELSTVNGELQQKVTHLSQASNDMNNLLASTGIGTVFVDHQLHIQRFTPNATQLINLIQTDVGRHVGHIASNLVGYHHLAADVQAVLDQLVPKEIEVQTQAGVWYLLSIRPYRTLENVIEGAVITFVDITRLKRAEQLHRLAVVVRDAHDAILLQDMQGRILAWNPAATRLYGWSEAEALAMNVQALVPEQRRTQALAIVQALSRSEVMESYHAEHVTKDGQIVEVWLTATALINELNEVYAIAETMRAIDLTKQSKASSMSSKEQDHD